MGTFGIMALFTCLVCFGARYFLTAKAAQLRVCIEKERTACGDARKRAKLAQQRHANLRFRKDQVNQRIGSVQKSLAHLEKASAELCRRDEEGEKVRSEQKEVLMRATHRQR